MAGLTRTGRLKSTDDFKRVLSRGRKFRSRHLCLVLTSGNDGEIRLGINIPVRVAKSSVRRNRLRRIIREWVSESSSRMQPGYDIVVMVTDDPGTGEGKLLRSELNGLADRSRLGVVR